MKLFKHSSKQKPAQKPPPRTSAATPARSNPQARQPVKPPPTVTGTPNPPTLPPNTLVVAIDFGTTYTGTPPPCHIDIGCAIAHSSKIRNVNDKRRLAEQIEVLKRWPGAGTLSTEKTPTIIAYDDDFSRVIAWGSKVTPQHKHQFTHFKLLLDSRTSAGKLEGQTGAGTGLPPEKTAVDVTTDYFGELYAYVMSVLANTYGEKFLAGQDLWYVITVPASCSDRSKALTLRAAREAGFTGGNVTLVTEPEAAAVYCATLSDEVGLKTGSKFLVCDAGGGTVDLITYQVDSMTPFLISECSIGTAGECGSLFLDMAFEDAVRARLGDRAGEVLKPRTVAEMVRHFKHFIKVEFKDDETVPYVNFAVPGAPDIPEAGIEGGFMTMSREELRAIFLPQFQRVLELVQGQIEQVNRKYGPASLRLVFLVGGLGSNTFLRKFLRHSLPPEINVKQPLDSAIVRGAVMYGLNSRVVQERILRRHYGIATSVVWDKDKHPLDRRWRDDLDGTWRVDVMRWYVAKGQRVQGNRKVEVVLFYNFDENEVLIRNCKLLCCAKDFAPLYPDDPAVEKVCEIQADLRSIPQSELTSKRAPDGRSYYRLFYAIAMTFRNSITFELIFNGKTYETAFAKY